MIPVPVPPTFVGLPDRDTSTPATPPSSFPAGVQCRLTCTGLWTERRTCPPTWSALVGRLREECVRLAHADDVPLLVFPEGTCCHRCDRLPRNEPSADRAGPTKTHTSPTSREGCRHPVDQGAFHRCDGERVRRSLLSVTRVGLPLTPPTRCPHGWGQGAFRGALQASRSGRARP